MSFLSLRNHTGARMELQEIQRLTRAIETVH
jgi:hypothetical protein